MLKTCRPVFTQIRHKYAKVQKGKQEKKFTACDRALEHFDDFYGSVFGKKWKSIRVALLTQHKYIALVNIFGDSDKVCKDLELNGAINMKSLFNLSKEKLKDQLSQNKIDHTNLDRKLDLIIKKQAFKEVEQIYPKNENDAIPEIVFHKVENDNTNECRNSEEINDIKKPLEKILEENYDLDESRLVDLSQGTGGLYDFLPTTEIKGMENWILESDHYKYYSTSTDFPLKIETETNIEFPEALSLYTYEKGNCSDFLKPYNCATGVLSHFLMDGGSILPPLMLNIKPGDKVLDACAAPGGKSLLMLQTLYPKLLVCNDIQNSRVERIRRLMKQYIFNFDDKWIGENRCIIQKCDALRLDEYETYDKILVDVPCTIDRHSLYEDDNNIFKPGRIKERLKIPETQSAILTNCLRLLKPGGSLVYSTCSLSPIQNDGVVHMALQRAFTDYGLSFIINDLSLTIRHFFEVFRFENPKNLKYGQLVLPYLPANFGPMYFCKISRK